MNQYEKGRKRKHFVPLRLDDDEYKKLKEWSAASKRTMSDYLRELLADCQPIAFPPAEYQEIMRELRKIGVNMNQIASKANVYGFIDERQYRAEADRLWRIVAELAAQMIKSGVKFGSYEDMGC